ncbi:MAG TPA: glycosyltransferase family 4 protein [Verrucomicrobiae bacterium]|jgi:glycosyltransferase involved in cell wall biosynthesis|nr:glycosyltransferase family 4 protein [Verrucomicrobiae bacterium]
MPLKIVQITPGAGKMFCGACVRDNALVSALRRRGHDALMAPLYLPLTLDETDESAGRPIFFGGINVYLEQQSAFFRKLPAWLHNLLASPRLLSLAAGAAGKTRAEDLGEMTISMLRGEQGHQARELDPLLAWLKTEKPDVVCLSNALLAGFARRIKAEAGVPVLCFLQGEDWFLDGLPLRHRAVAWETAAERAQDVDLFVAPSVYFGELMARRLKLAPARVQVVVNGIQLHGYDGPSTNDRPVLGYFARMCREKGLETLVEAFIRLKQRGRVPNLALRVGGSCGPADQIVVDEMKARLRAARCLEDATFFPNVTRAEKIQFLQSLTVFSAPATYGEAFGLYVAEAMAAGVPVAQPRHAAFPELIDATGGGVLCEPNNPDALADALESLLLDPARARALGENGRRGARAHYDIDIMAERMENVCAGLLPKT